MFALFDTNNDGKITSAELGKVLKRVNQNVSEEDIKLLIKEIDFNGESYLYLYTKTSLD